jgi:hypothetical protein
MKNSTKQNKLDLLDWVLSIDFDPVEIIRLRCNMPTTYDSVLDEKVIRSKRGD